MRVAVGSDHRGFHVENSIGQYLRGRGFDVLDMGTFSEESVDYPDRIFGGEGGFSRGRRVRRSSFAAPAWACRWPPTRLPVSGRRRCTTM